MSDRTIMIVGGLNRSAPYFPNARGNGLSVFDFDEASGETRFLCETTTVDNPAFLSIDAGGEFVYAGSEVFGWPEGTVSVYRFDPALDRLWPVNKQPTLGSITAYNSFDRTGHFLLVANYSMTPVDELPNKAAAVFSIRADGGLAPPVSSVTHHGKGPNPDRQERPHPHCIVTTPDNRFAVVADLGLDALFAYPFGVDGTLDEGNAVRTALPPGAGPRHLVFHANGTLAFLICELSSTIVSLRYRPEGGTFDNLGTASTVPQGFVENYCSDIQLHPSGRFLYGANRGHDSVAIFAVDQETGLISPLGRQPCGGKTPRNLAIDPSGRFLLAANQNSNNIAIFAIDEANGTLKEVRPALEIGTPMCIKFARIARKV